MIDEEIHTLFIGISCLKTFEDHTSVAVKRHNLSHLFALSNAVVKSTNVVNFN